MKARVVAGLAVAVATTVATGAEDSTTPWGGGLPIVEATKTEVGPGKYLWGSALLLAVPDRFQEYWPDYGYRWSNATYVELCRDRGQSDSMESSNLGRVRLVAEAGEKAERLIGIELRPDGETANEPPSGESKTTTDKAEFTVEELCALLSDDVGRQRVESMVRLMAGVGTNVLESGKWHGKKLDFVQDAGLDKSKYMLLWMGSGVEEGLDVAGKINWVAEGKPVVVWHQPSKVTLESVYEMGGRPIVMAFYEKPGYMLTKMGGVMDITTSYEATTFQVVKGVIDKDFLVATNLQPTDLDEAMFGVWAEVEKYKQMMDQTDRKVWLVTENAIPKKSLAPEIRVGDRS